jgi:hypothetical protein
MKGKGLEGNLALGPRNSWCVKAFENMPREKNLGKACRVGGLGLVEGCSH